MKSSRRRTFAIFSIVIVAVLGLIGVIVYPTLKQRWTAPLGPSLDLPTYTPTSQAVAGLAGSPSPAPASTSNSAGMEASATAPVLVGVSQTTPQAPTATDTPVPTATARPLCGGPQVMTVLAVGADSGIDYLYGLGDVIRIVRVDYVTPKVTVLSMPRDLWVELPPGIKPPDGEEITHSKLNQSYFYGGPGMGYYDGPGAGPGLMARTLDLNFGARVDHYGAVNMQTFVKIINAVGGIDIYLPTDVDGRPVDDRTEDMGYFYAGQQHFNGDQALRFARIRKKYNDFTRMDHQNMVMCALKKKLESPTVLAKLPKIIAAFQGSVLTDLSPEQIGQFACLLPSLKRENLIFTSLPAEIFSSGRVYSPIQKNETFVLEADFSVIRDYVTRFLAGEWPDKPDEPSCP